MVFSITISSHSVSSTIRTCRSSAFFTVAKRVPFCTFKLGVVLPTKGGTLAIHQLIHSPGERGQLTVVIACDTRTWESRSVEHLLAQLLLHR